MTLAKSLDPLIKKAIRITAHPDAREQEISENSGTIISSVEKSRVKLALSGRKYFDLQVYYDYPDAVVLSDLEYCRFF